MREKNAPSLRIKLQGEEKNPLTSHRPPHARRGSGTAACSSSRVDRAPRGPGRARRGLPRAHGSHSNLGGAAWAWGFACGALHHRPRPHAAVPDPCGAVSVWRAVGRAVAASGRRTMFATIHQRRHPRHGCPRRTWKPKTAPRRLQALPMARVTSPNLRASLRASAARSVPVPARTVLLVHSVK